MQISAINNKQNFSFKSKIVDTSTLGFGINRAIELGDKGFFNAIKHLANDDLERKIVIGGSNSSSGDFVNATVILNTENLKYSISNSRHKKYGIDSFQLMGDNVIELVKKLAEETGIIPQELIKEKSTKYKLLKESNELYRTIFIG